MTVSLEARGLVKSYGSALVVKDFSHAFPAGKVTALVGPSGSGKTTILSMLAGLVVPEGGRVILDGRDITAIPAESRGFGVVFQNYLLFPHLTVRENVEFGLRVRAVGRTERRMKAAAALERVGLGPVADRRVQAISGGEAQRVALARALAFGPRVLLLDEPLSALDAQLRETLRGDLRRLFSELNLTTIYVTHDQAEALGLGDELIVLQEGRIEQAGPPLEVYSRPATPFVAGFLGAANVFPGLCTDRAGVRELDLPFARVPAPAHAPVGPCRVVLRPEDFEIAQSRDEHFLGECESSMFLGASVRLVLRSRNERITVDVPGDLGSTPRAVWPIRIRTDRMCFLSAEGTASPGRRAPSPLPARLSAP